MNRQALREMLNILKILIPPINLNYHQIIVEEDNMRAKKRALVTFKLFGSFLLIILLVACAGRVFTYRDLWVAEDNRISL